MKEYVQPLTVPQYAYGREVKVDTHGRTVTLVVAGTTVWPTGTLVSPDPPQSLLNPNQGVQWYYRSGPRTLFVGLRINGFFSISSQQGTTVPRTGQFMRLLIVWDKQVNQAVPAPAGLFESTQNQFSAIIANYNALLVPSRYEILYDKFFTLQDPNMVGSTSNQDINGQVLPFSIIINPPCQIFTNYVNGTNQITDIIDNTIHMFCACYTSQSTVALTYQCHTYFVDAT